MDQLAHAARELKQIAALDAPEHIDHLFPDELRLIAQWDTGTWKLGLWRREEPPSEAEVAACLEGFQAPRRRLMRITAKTHYWTGYIFHWDGPRERPSQQRLAPPEDLGK